MAFILKIMISGSLLLLAAIVINALGRAMKLASWYDVFTVKNIKIGVASLLWLYIIYPLALGIVVYEIATRFICK